jgi:hypothetical protein
MVVLDNGRGGTRLPDFVESEQETHGVDTVFWRRFGA